jgi:hypothetical protein
MTGKPPTESNRLPVPDYPGWDWWDGVAGLLYAAHANGIDPPVVVSGRNFTELLGRIRAADAYHWPH